MRAIGSRRPRKKDRPEKVVLAEVMLDLQAAWPTGIWWRQNAGKVETVRGSWVELGPAGISDVVGFLPGGQIVFIETKRRTGKLRERQRIWQREVEAAGAVYVVARSGPEAVAGVAAGLLRKGSPTAQGHGVPSPAAAP